MPARTLCPQNLDFMLFSWLDVGELLTRERFADHSMETVKATVGLAAEIAEEVLLPSYKAGDRDEPVQGPEGVRVNPAVRDAVRAFGKAGLTGGPFDTRHDGLQIPETVHATVMAYC